MTQMSTRRGKFRRRAEIVLLLAGMAGICVWIAGNAMPIVSQDWGNWVFDREVHGQTATLREYLSNRSDIVLSDIAAEWRALQSRGNKSSTVVETGPPAGRPNAGNVLKERDLIGRLEIPRLNLKTIVREGAREGTLSIAAGHVPSTALPGQPGNVAVAGHRDTLFRELKGIRNGDLIQFETLNGSYVYQVESTQVVKPTAVSVLNPGPYSQLTLVTCYPFTFIGSAPERFIVTARQVLESSMKPDLSNIPATAKISNKPPRADLVQSGEKAGPSKQNEEPRSHSVSRSATAKVNFSVATDHSRQLAPGISMGVSMIDPEYKVVNGWIWVMPDRRTVWMDRQPLRDPVVFYQDGKIRELILTNAGSDSATGYLLTPDTMGD